MASTEGEKAENPATGDSGPGTSLKDILPIPHDTSPVTEPGKKEIAQTLQDDPSLSHALATDDHDEKGIAQLGHEKEVRDLGWNEKKQNIAAPLVGGISNEELWLLVRRFNKQMYHVKAYPYAVPGNLDLNIADDEEFSPDKLRANIERLYMTVIVGVLGVIKHIARLRSWRETKRTAWFCGVYFVAWAFDLIVPLLSATLIALIAYPPSREFLFPPAPLALVDAKSGGVQKPKSGVLGSHDSATGAPENHKGEAVEQEASNFVSSIASVALSSATGKHPQGDPDSSGEGAQEVAPDPTAMAVGAADAKDAAEGQKASSKHDKTKVPVETAMWTKMRPIMHGIADFTDTWERFANALSPTPPFPRDTYRLRLAAVVMPLFGISLFVTSYMFMKGVTFGIGFGFFGDPVISRGLNWLNRTIPNWQKLLELRNTLLKGVPTNAQLTITLLRVGEANKAPLPPPPRIDQPPPEKPAQVTDKDLRATGAEPPLNATDAELDAAMEHDPTVAHETDGADINAAKTSKHGKHGSKILGLFKGTTKGAVKTAIGTDSVRAKIGSHHAKDRLGVVPRPGSDLTSGPVEFKARFNGKKGHAYISTAATIPAVAFSTDSTIEKIGTQEREDLHPLWTIAVADIAELKKIGGYGWKAKLVVGWSMEREVADGLEIKTVTGESYKITACPLRDELFNRLVAMGGQKWEAW
ncbi:uncharacterized protein E0L32_012069 [Thyridium curvatum]|uniref:Uncharacterized protein n=1 Tax=Thyridium curvatum TaxID=1093900 RepID=A0A507BFS6_9PEZI|nr:uncharacterized protein E0L32_012069 [Thyridium curvatum]TPX17624.1 hypothetical protein E0L32_012069 [Thyridium curvatum]